MRLGLRRLWELGTKHLFVFSLCLASLLYGIVAGHYGLFPYQQLREAKSAAKALADAFREESNAKETSLYFAKTEPIARNHARIDDGALFLVSGGRGYLTSHSPKDGCLAWLMDRQGTVKHVWKFSPKLWSELKHVSTALNLSEIYPVDIHVLEDGGLIASFQATHTWPFAVGIARLDKDSNVIWQNECHAHHWFTITPNQEIITPTLRIVETPLRIGDTLAEIVHQDGKVLEDKLAVMSLDGEILHETSMLQVVQNSGLIGLYHDASGDRNVNSMDPLHLNDVQRVGEEVASAHAWLNADDLLVSFRNTNSIAILDHSTKRVKWLTSGTTVRQHSPRFLGAHHLLVFDNLGGTASLGGTRIARLDLNTRLAETVFPTVNHQPPEPTEVYTETAGYLDLHESHDKVLMTVPGQGRVMEIDLETREVLWEYFFPDRLNTVKYCPSVSFQMNSAHEAP